MSARKKRPKIISNTAAIYARYSSTNQREESIEAQVRACQEYAKRNDLIIVDTYADSAKTGTNAEREEFQRMIADSAAGKFEYIIVHKLDRFSRDRYDSVVYKRKLKMNGVTLRSVLENLDGSPESLILESLLEAMAAYYSQNLARESLKGMKENAYKCIYNGGVLPLGYSVDKETRKFIINEDEAIVIRYIFSTYADGFGFKKIIKYLNDNGFRTREGRLFSVNGVHDILKNIRYTGVYTFNMKKEKDAAGVRNHRPKSKEEQIMIERGMPAIIDKDTFDRVQKKMAENRRKAGFMKAHVPNLLSGFIYCAECGAKYYGFTCISRRGYVTRYYKCVNYSAKMQCDNKMVRKEAIEEFVVENLIQNIFAPKKFDLIKEYYVEYQRTRKQNLSQKEALLRKEDKLPKEKIDKIVQFASESGISIDTVSQELEELEGKRSSIAVKLEEMKKRQY
ncbi:MAG: recombinase family protein [Pyramidobacter sp.]|uniref:recombinase family protein n=1 Tax=Pyramidobacter sp. TaxID=1943581 RepID=UPI002A8398AD|nr:recombinase family protein [Pyramidobacter sp.]MDY4031538.1 recombinase family protein [Pyramidobacter sp.]